MKITEIVDDMRRVFLICESPQANQLGDSRVVFGNPINSSKFLKITYEWEF